MNEVKIIIGLIVLMGIGFGAGWATSNWATSREYSGRLNHLGKELDFFRDGYARKSEENKELIRLSELNRITIKSARGLIEETTRGIDSGIGTIRQAIESLRAIKGRLLKVEAVLSSQELDNRGIGGTGGR